MAKKLQRNFVYDTLVAAFLVLVVGIFSVWSLRQINKSNFHQRVSNSLQNQIDLVLEDVQFADISQLKYIGTGSELYKNNYLEAKDKTEGDVTEFFRLGLDRENFEHRYGEIRNITSEYFGRADSYIHQRDLDENFRPEIVAHEIDGDLIRRLNKIAEAVNDRENTTFVMHEMAISEYSLWAGVGIFLVILLAVGFLIYSMFVTRKEIKSRLEITEDLRVAQISADRASRMRNQFYAVISHELRTPLNGIIGMSELLKEKLSTDEQHEYLKIIRESGNSLLKMVNDLLNISKIESGRLELEIREFALPEIVDQAVTLVRLRAKERGLFLKTSIDEKIARRYFGDGERIKQVLVNLLTNAVKYTNHGGVYFRAKLKQTSGTSLAVVRFEIEDTGVGIKESDRAAIFTPFQQIKGNGAHAEGFGLGLAIVKSIVELMRGEIDFTSEPGRGSTFWCEIPLRVAGDWVQKSEALRLKSQGIDFKEANPPAVRSQKHILIVEDNPTNQILIQSYLRKMGHEFEMADNGQEALQILEETKPDLILMDCSMPIMDGYEATLKIRAKENEERVTSPVPIIALTAHAMDEERQKCLSIGMTDYLSKPFTLSEFKDMVDNYLRDKTQTAQEAAQDQSVFQALVEEAGDETTKVLMQSFQNTLTKVDGDLAKAYERNQQLQIQQLCHLIRSSAQMLGFRGIAELSEKIERAIKENQYRSQDVIKLKGLIQAALSEAWPEPKDDSLPPSQSLS